jgi:predicted DNA-binding transcriptional regulator AlpA
MTFLRQDLIADPAESLSQSSVETDELFRVLGRSLAPLLLTADISTVLSEVSAEQRRAAARLLTDLASRSSQPGATTFLERQRQHRDKPLQALPPELIRSRIFETAEAASFCGFSVPHWRRLYRSRKVPKPIQLSTRKLGWRAGDLIDWLQTRLDSS